MAPEQRSKVRLDEFVAKVVPDPNSPGELLLVSGFLGKSSEEDHTRVYWDPSLNSYVDVRDTDIVHTEALSKEASPLGGSYVWVKRDAEVYFGAGGQSTKGKFFQGRARRSPCSPDTILPSAKRSAMPAMNSL
jgi:hypothetical protein